MKKAMKLTALLLAVIMITVSLCSCQALEEKKANRAIYSDDLSEITYQDNVYRFISVGKYDFVSDFNYSWASRRVTEKNVPVLLSDWYGEYFELSEDGSIIKVNSILSNHENNRINLAVRQDMSDYGYAFYVRTDQYDSIKEAIDNAKLDHYYFSYWNSNFAYGFGDAFIDSKESVPNQSGYVNILLDDDLTDTVNQALKAKDADKTSYKELSDGYQRAINLYLCDKDMLLTDKEILYYLVQDGDKYYFWDGNTYQEKCLVALSKDDAQAVGELFEQYPDAVYEQKISDSFDYLVVEDGPVEDA